ncbi:cytochrome c biogenesis protein DipZ [Paucibacter sp. XJ19-41]|uniref:cytochrome c biogenesis protein DipZ n=1 Tax=Paucibacter sp. XJ19-41 TaxID=2927824 RepID=UPI00234A5D28|nr:cytochrome c biogenesis protein DipZ [Paucibacter sp. XJ19-41]MDC6169971.1 cytochrome c biogenesis protein DipZ [Paucibacter sp. XJ19-41]
MLQILLSFGAGIATVTSPCILPMLPLLLGASLGGTASRARPLLIVLGFVLSFAGAALLFGASTRALGLSPDLLRNASIAVLLMFGLLLAWPALLERAMAGFGHLGGLAALGQRLGERAGAGPAGALLLGLSLGLLWTPCAGPVLASLLALVAGEQDALKAFGLLLAYAVGAGLPMLAIAYGGQAVTRHVRGLARHMGRVRQGFGLLVMATALAIYAQVDTQLVAWLSRGMPAAQAEPATPAATRSAPEFAGITRWFNSAPLTMEQLRGRVVLVDFWTFDCVNCINTLPHLRRWSERHADQGLVVVGVHTPEFGFERDSVHLQAAIKRHRLPYPVAQDNGWKTWSAWGVRYWPSLFLIDRQGRLVFQHVGEGDYEEIERQIRQALGPQ